MEEGSRLQVQMMYHRSMFHVHSLCSSWVYPQLQPPPSGAWEAVSLSLGQFIRVLCPMESVVKLPDGSSSLSLSPHSILHAGTYTFFIRRALPQKAWTSTINPITQKNSSQLQQNGNLLQQKPVGPAKTSIAKEYNTADKQAHDRLTFILAASTVGRI